MKEKKVYQSWSDYERVLIIRHYRKFGLANQEGLAKKMTYRSIGSISCEINKFDSWQRTGVMEYGSKWKHRNGRCGTRETYTRIIDDLDI